MSDVPVQVIVAAFQTLDGASNALAELSQAKKDKLIQIQDAAVLIKDLTGKVKIKETQDMRMGKGAAIGAVAGGVLSLLAGPLGWMALGGGLIGGLAAKLADGGFPDAQLKELAESMTLGSSILVAVIDHKWVEAVERELSAQNARFVRESLKAELAQALQSDKDFVFTVADTGEEILVAQATRRDGKVEMEEINTSSPSAAIPTTTTTGGDAVPIEDEGKQKTDGAMDMPATTTPT